MVEIGKREKVSKRYVSRIIRFAFLAPEIVEQIVNGCQPPEFTAESTDRPLSCRRTTPGGDGGQGPFRPLGQLGQPTKVNCSGIAVQRQKIALVQNCFPDAALAVDKVDFQPRETCPGHKGL